VVAIAFVFGYIDVDAGRWLWLEDGVGVHFSVWGKKYLLGVGIQDAIL
jgi:hypothetical protein